MDYLKNKPFLTVKDYTVSSENFELLYDETLDMLITHPQPESEDLSKYYESENYISHTDGKRSLFEKAYQLVKSKTLKRKLNLINSLQKQKGTILDIGAGTGDFLMVAKGNGWNILGIEPNDKAKEIAETKGVIFSKSTQELKEHSFDVITMWHVLEHVPNLEIQIKELKRLLTPNGTLLIAVPNFNSFDAKHYGVFWAAYDVPRHLWHFSKTAIKKLFANEKMDLVKIIPMPFDAFYVALLSEKYKNGKMNFLKAFFIGLKSNWKARKNLEFSSHIYVIKNTNS